jgi:uncharacterized repeat protein (TIGR01451 family)
MTPSIRRTGALLILLCLSLSILPLNVQAGSYSGHDLAVAMLTDPSVLISSSYWDRDTVGHRQSTVLTTRGALIPTQGSNFSWFSTGRADLVVATSGGLDPGNERGDWFQGGQYGSTRDEANLQMTLQVPAYMHYLYYDVQFFTVEYPDYVGTQYNDKLTITVVSPSKGTSSYIIDVNGGDFVLHANDAPLLGTGYNLYAQSGTPEGVDWLQTTPVANGADAGATALVGRQHPVSPGETITVTIDLTDIGDNQFDSATFVDNMHFSGYAKPQIMARKTALDLNGGLVQCGDIIEYDLTLSNIGTANQNNNAGHEFEDFIPTNTQYVTSSATAGSGSISYDSGAKKIVWDGAITAQSSVALSFKITINNGLVNNTLISNQGVVHWDENEDGINEKDELTDDPNVPGDHNPTNLTVWSYTPPTTLTEDFTESDDIVGGTATESYQGQVWFQTSAFSGTSNFEVAPTYHFQTIKSFKTKLRASAGSQYWNYSFATLNSAPIAWSCWFACGNSSEPADLTLDFKTSANSPIAKLKFEYMYDASAVKSSCYPVRLSYYTSSGWVQLSSDYPNGYLNNNWYNLLVEKVGETSLKYTLTRYNGGITDQDTTANLGSGLSSLSKVVWTSASEPVVSPIIFWDEHTLTMLPNT